MWVIIIYIATLVLTGILLYLLLKYLKEKPFGGQLVTGHLSIDLIISLFTLVLVTCVSVIGRELFGPFNSIGAETCLILQQLASSSLAFNLLSVQVAQFCSILLSVRYVYGARIRTLENESLIPLPLDQGSRLIFTIK